MSKVLVAIAALISCVLADPLPEDTGSWLDTFSNSNDSNQLQAVPDINGSFYNINVTSQAMEYSKTNKPDYKVDFYLINQQNPGKGKRVTIGDVNSLKEASFNPKNPTRIIVHGWRGDRESIVNEVIPAGYLRRGNYNVFVVDWSDASQNYDYLAVCMRIGIIGRKIGKFIDFLSLEAETPPSTVYLFGHSLGAHVTSIAAKHTKSGRIGVIVAFDAALPLFPDKNKSRLRSSDAEYVLSLHTNGGRLGIFEPIGHASFYPNWGRQQPGCGIDPFASCSHGRSVEYFAESLYEPKSEFVSYKCNSFEEIINRKCSKKSEIAYMGGDPLHTGYNGVFYLKTNSRQPFSVKKKRI